MGRRRCEIWTHTYHCFNPCATIARYLGVWHHIERGRRNRPQRVDFGRWQSRHAGLRRNHALKSTFAAKTATRPAGRAAIIVRIQVVWNWRPRPESNRGIRICSPLRHHSATWPSGPDTYLPALRGARSFLPPGTRIVKFPGVFRSPARATLPRSGANECKWSDACRCIGCKPDLLPLRQSCLSVRFL
jgi:hypothetical protein